MAKAATSKRYAQALFAIAQEKGVAEAWMSDLTELVGIFENSTVQAFMDTPRVRAEEKQRLVVDVARGYDPMVSNLIGLLVSRGSTGMLAGIADSFGELLNTSLGKTRATVTTAIPMHVEQRKRLATSLTESVRMDVVLETAEDPEIIGGVVVRVGDQVVDGSVRTKLASLGLKLAQESIR